MKRYQIIYLVNAAILALTGLSHAQQPSYSRTSNNCLFALIDKNGKIVQALGKPRIKIEACSEGAKSKPPKSWPLESAGTWQLIGSPAEAVNSCECKNAQGTVVASYDLNDTEKLNFACQQRCNTELCKAFDRKSCKKTTTITKIADAKVQAKLAAEKAVADKKIAEERAKAKKAEVEALAKKKEQEEKERADKLTKRFDDLKLIKDIIIQTETEFKQADDFVTKSPQHAPAHTAWWILNSEYMILKAIRAHNVLFSASFTPEQKAQASRNLNTQSNIIKKALQTAIAVSEKRPQDVQDKIEVWILRSAYRIMKALQLAVHK